MAAPAEAIAELGSLSDTSLGLLLTLVEALHLDARLARAVGPRWTERVRRLAASHRVAAKNAAVVALETTVGRTVRNARAGLVPDHGRTMNTAERSIALLDTALRRRFGFVEAEAALRPLTWSQVSETGCPGASSSATSQNH